MGRILVLVRVSGLLVAVLVLVWAFGFRASFLQHSDSDVASATYQLDHLYSALHPLLMVIGFILLSGEAILAHRWLSAWSRSMRKSVHLSLQGAALGFGLFGIWAKFKGRIGILANFYSLHSWMGLLCLLLFAFQWTVGFLRLWHRPEGRRTRAAVLPWHAFIGLYTYGLAVVTAETGLIEKLTFLQTRRGVPRRSTESTLVNALGLALALVSALVIYAAVSQKHHHLPYSNEMMACGSIKFWSRSGVFDISQDQALSSDTATVYGSNFQEGMQCKFQVMALETCQNFGQGQALSSEILTVNGN